MAHPQRYSQSTFAPGDISQHGPTLDPQAVETESLPQPLHRCHCQPSCWLCLIQESNYIIFKSPNLLLFLLCTSPRQSQSISPSLLLGSKLQLGCRICSRTREAKLFPAAAIARGLLCQSGNITGGGRKGPGYLAVARKLKLKVTSR